MNRSRQHSQRGSAVLAVALLSLVALTYISSTLISSLAVKRQSRAYVASQRAYEIAESGVHQLIARLATDQGPGLLVDGTANGTMEAPDGTVNRFEIALWSAADDGADNDQDGVADEADEANLVEVRSTGRFDGIRRTVRVTLLARYRDANVTSATYLDDPNASLNFAGNSFRIKGEDHDLDGNETGDLAAGIGVPGSIADILNQIDGKDAGNISGAGGSPSVQEVDELDMQALIEEGARSANVSLTPGSTTKPSEEGAWGTIDAPAIVYSPGDVKISGGAAGAGILLVDGDLDISGSFEWKGLIIVRGGVRFTGGGGLKRLLGALVVQSRLEEDESVDLDLRGTIEILFSRQAVNRVMKSFATYTVLNLREDANPE